jgi:alkaline phosphatase
MLLFPAGRDSPPSASQSGAPAKHPKYIFIFLADGAGITHIELTRLYKQLVHKEGLALADAVMHSGHVGFLTTHAADSLVTDSAAAATSMAMGCKAKAGVVGLCADGSRPPTIIEAAKERGMKVGLITTAEVYDASPAAFATHVRSRRLSAEICAQYLNFGPDLLMGGGRNYFLPQDQPGRRRKDDKDLIALFKEKGYFYASTKRELMFSACSASKILILRSIGQTTSSLPFTI